MVSSKCNQYLQQVSCNYRPQMKLREGNVFTGVCLSMWGVCACLVPGTFWGCAYLVPGPLQGVGTHLHLPHMGYRILTPPPFEGTAPYWHLVVATKADGTHPTGMHFYHPQTKFTVILSIGGSAPLHAGIHTPPGRYASYWNAILLFNILSHVKSGRCTRRCSGYPDSPWYYRFNTIKAFGNIH